MGKSGATSSESTHLEIISENLIRRRHELVQIFLSARSSTRPGRQLVGDRDLRAGRPERPGILSVRRPDAERGIRTQSGPAIRW
jgi:hypothetical protein